MSHTPPPGVPVLETYDGVPEAVEDVAPVPPFPELTEREREVALLLIRGEDGNEISVALGIGKKTYDTHRGHILKKLGCKNTPKLMLLALARGYL